MKPSVISITQNQDYTSVSSSSLFSIVCGQNLTTNPTINTFNLLASTAPLPRLQSSPQPPPQSVSVGGCGQVSRHIQEDKQIR
ncbi:hypothetical protein Pcinc_029573 [Petrolisthes cinctipes]|uniref:Uncharacterized protein n=1 Tax=Petrolisthes cinctipes TaxID=88211 RepID=A0AAE1K5I5_PETCI|nr:hypothetical protein Pcinc_029573 [Petrolisthes cinctipes]